MDVALYESVFAVMESLLPEYSVQQFVRQPSGASLPGISPSGTYPSWDGHYVIVAANGDSIYRRLMTAIGRPDLANDPRFARNDGRVEHNQFLEGVIGEWIGQRHASVVVEMLQLAEVPTEKVYTIADIAADPHYRARGMLEPRVLPDGTPVDIPGIVPRLSATPGATRWLGPKLGQHTDEVLLELGYDARRIADLRARGVI